MTVRLRYLSTTLALFAVAVGVTLLQPKPPRPGPVLPLRATPPSQPAPPAPPPTARQILDRGGALGLTADQRGRLETLDRAWQRDVGPLEAAIEAAGAEFERFMREARAARGASLVEIERRSAEFRELSATWREARRRHGEMALGFLTDEQHRTLLAEPLPDHTRGGRR